MRTIRNRFLVIALLLGLLPICGMCYAADTDPKQSLKGVSLNSAVAPTANETAKEELAVLRATLEAEREHNSAVLQTVYWSLGVLATIAAALVGFGWLVNFRVYERDKEQLQKTVLDGLSKETADARFAQERLRERLEKQNSESLTRVRDEILDKALKTVDERTSHLLRLISQGERTSRLLQLDLEQIKAEYLFEKGQNGRGFSSSLNAVALAQSLGQASVIEYIIGDLEKQIRKMNGVFGSDIAKISEALGNLEGISAIQRDRLTEVLMQAKRL